MKPQEDPDILEFYAAHGFRFIPSARFLIENYEVSVYPVGYMLSKHNSTPEEGRAALRIYEADFSQTPLPKGRYCYDEARLETFQNLEGGQQ
jgi:hypothetical protein